MELVGVPFTTVTGLKTVDGRLRSCALTLCFAVTAVGSDGQEPVREPEAIGINFEGGGGWSIFRRSAGIRVPARPLRLDQVAGLVPQKNWNNAAGSVRSAGYGRIPIIDAKGAVTGVTLSYEAAGTYNVGFQGEEEGDYVMMDGYLDNENDTTITVELSGIPYRDYFVVVYHDGGNADMVRWGKYTMTDGRGLSRSVISTDLGDLGFTGRYQSSWDCYSWFGMIRGETALKIEATGFKSTDRALRAPLNGLQIVDVTNRVDLSDIVGGGDGLGGGDGFGTGIGRGLTAAKGKKWVTINAGDGGETSFPDLVVMPDEPLVDSVFVPGAGVPQRISTGGHEFAFEGGGGGPSNAIFNGDDGIGSPSHESNSGLSFEDLIGVGSQHGITFDLEAIRGAGAVGELTAFTAIAGENRNIEGGSVGCYVLVDGETIYHEPELSDSERYIYVEIAPEARFLTLAMTGGKDGLGFFSNPYLLYSPSSPSLFSKIFSTRNVLIALVGLILVGVLVSGIGWMRGRARMRVLQHQQAIESERRRIARDMHDEAGAQLARIAILSQLTDEEKISSEGRSDLIESIRATSREAVRRFDQIVWAVDPECDSLRSFVDFLTSHAKDYFEGTGVDCRLDISREVPDILLNAQVRGNLLRVCEEAMSNILKHSGASRVVIELAVEGRELAIRFSDNGCGLSAEEPPSDAHGLRNMRQRMEKLGGNVDIEGGPGSGTAVAFTVPLSDSGGS